MSAGHITAQRGQGERRKRPRPAPATRLLSVAAVVLLALTWGAEDAPAQYRIVAPSGEAIAFPADTLRRMLDTTRALYADLEEDPRVGYTLLFGPAVRPEAPDSAFPWNAVQVRSDSTAMVRTPGNLREAARAYYNYAVRRMRVVRGADPDVSCDSLIALEQGVMAAFADGWVVARTLFGGPPFAPLDEVVFAQRAGLLKELLAARRDRQLGACAGEWAEANADAVSAYEAWRASAFLAPDEPGDEEPGPSSDAADERPETREGRRPGSTPTRL